MRILVTGARGQLGCDVIKEIIKRGYEGVGTDLAQSPQPSGTDLATSQQECAGTPGEAASAETSFVPMDITDREQVLAVFGQVRPDVVIHCAAWTAVDAAEDPENREKVEAINARGTRYVAEAAKETGAAMIYLSTDYVFDGQGTEPWDPDSDAYAPLNVYGKSKLEGELAVRELLDKYYIVRIAWVFGEHGNNFVRTMLRLGQTHGTLRVVSDQIGTPTYTPDLAKLLIDMAETDRYGYYHATNEGGFISWYEFAKEIFRQAGIEVQVIPVTTSEYGLSKAKRPFNSRLDKSKLTRNGFERLPGPQGPAGHARPQMRSGRSGLPVCRSADPQRPAGPRRPDSSDRKHSLTATPSR